MEPRLPLSPSSPEIGNYYHPDTPQPIEISDSQKEKQNGILEKREVQHDIPLNQPQIPITTPALPVLPQLSPADEQHISQQAVNDNPPSASDDELIEKEWVDKAKRIVRETKSDPYRQENEVSKLQADYVKKRYGKVIKPSN